ncbi:phosphate signaling complex protein PhoU [Aestuariibacter halophilus]|uniref:Phosphate-specific transport system accessory protein PhoU n=1 Tax=Fluctibacter halophilus TaxID=226011 RepID=A0ABS8GC48_9ALTE|nr:phosphate signaling complex protein PhoU [Aestuariibacter halophilus]MCC2618073.1 phosphate signaling complex protein PhoU [Aestuariibacter halophilus]
MDKLHLDKHISQQFDSELEDLKSQVLEMGGMVEQQIIDAVESLESADSKLAEKVMRIEDEIDLREVALDEACMTVLACRQPAASDLRMVLTVTKMTRDLERMGDEAQKIAKMAISLTQDGAAPGGYEEVRHMGTQVQNMVHSVLDAFARFDVEKALNVAKADKQVDREYKSAMREIVTYMMEDPRSIGRVMNILWALRSLERIGDHTRNLAEHIIFLVKGLDVRHVTVSEIERKIQKSQ